jgi:putative FmdB family regulatory protein
MPIYEYVCRKCGRKTEVIQNHSDKPPKCSHCGGTMKKAFSAPAIQFKGSGFYLTDYGKAGARPAESGSEGGDKAEKSGEKAEKAEKADKADKSEKAEKSDKPEKSEKKEPAVSAGKTGEKKKKESNKAGE